MWDLFSAVLDLFTISPPWRVTVKDRYEMKRKVRELIAKEKSRTAKPKENR
jgi:hypothetical protein